MKKIGIITFQFAHNYGAVLQAYSLKCFLERSGYIVKVMGEIPNGIDDLYKIAIFSKPFDLKKMIRRIFVYFRRRKQYNLFRGFIDSSLLGKSDGIKEKPDILLFGSDQIWNTKLTGDTNYYFEGPENCEDCPKIAYAASFGAKELSDLQRSKVDTYLASFSSVSLREEDGSDYVSEATSKRPVVVLDPVFLNDYSFWDVLAGKGNIKADFKYILFYALKNDRELIRVAEELAKRANLHILIVHPTCLKQHVRGEQLTNVGPYEFLYLIKNAAYVATNSFHASAFSAIFKKKLVRATLPKEESRVESLLKRMNIKNEACVKNYGIDIIDFSIDGAYELDAEISASKDFLNKSLERAATRNE